MLFPSHVSHNLAPPRLRTRSLSVLRGPKQATWLGVVSSLKALHRGMGREVGTPTPREVLDPRCGVGAPTSVPVSLLTAFNELTTPSHVACFGPRRTGRQEPAYSATAAGKASQ